MPIDASIYSNVQPQSDPLKQYAALSALKGQQQQQQMGALELQEKTRQMAAETALNNAMSGALDASGNIDEGKLQKGLVGTPAASKWPEIQQHLSSLREAKQKMAAAEADHVGSLASAAEAAGDDPMDQAGVLAAGIAAGVRDGSIPRDHGQQILQNILGPDGQPDPQAVKRTIATMKVASTKQTELASARMTAQARMGATQTGIQREAREAGEAKLREPLIVAQTQEAQARVPEIQAQATKAQAEADQLKALGNITGPATTTPDVPSGQKNEAFLQTLPSGLQTQVKMLAEGKLQVPSGFALRSPYWQGLLQATAKYDPTFDAVNYNARAKTRAAFTAGKEAQQVNALNTVIGHLDTLSKAADELHNTSIPLLNKVENIASQAVGRPTVTNFNVTRKAVADELTRVWRQAGGSEKDIQENLQNLNAAGSPEQLHGAIATFGDLLESKLASLNEQYRQGMGTDKVDILTPQARETLSRLETKAGRQPQTAPIGAQPAVPSGKAMIRARDPQGKLHEAPAGTALPPGWKLEP